MNSLPRSGPSLRASTLPPCSWTSWRIRFVLCAAKRGKADEGFCKRELFGKTLFDGGDNAYAKIVVDSHAVFPCP